MAYTLEAESRIDERPRLGQPSDKKHVEIPFVLFNGFSFFDFGVYRPRKGSSSFGRRQRQRLGATLSADLE